MAYRIRRCFAAECDLGQVRRQQLPIGDTGIDDGSVLRGGLPKTAAKLVEQWRTLHHDELLADWELAQEPTSLNPIEPLQ